MKSMKIKNLVNPIKVLASALLALSSASLHAETVRVDFSGNFFLSSDSTGLFSRAGVTNGDAFTGSFTYDTASLAYITSSYSTGTNALYTPISESWQIGGNKLTASLANSGQLLIESTVTGPWYWTIYDHSAMTVVNPLTLETANITDYGWLSDRNASQASSLGVNLPDSSTLSTLVNPSSNLGYEIFFRDNSNGRDWGVQNYTWSVQTVPEPSTYALFCLGALVLVIAARRRRTA